MNPLTHVFVSWSVANIVTENRRDRALITLAGVIPDVDGLGAVADYLSRNAEQPLEWGIRFHHIIAHNLGFGLLVAVATFLLATRRWLTGGLALLSFHLHLLGDLVGSRGPEGYEWPIPYLLPFSDAWELTWGGQWALNAWPNFLVTGGALALTFFVAWKRGFSPLEMISGRAVRVFVDALRDRFGYPEES